MNNSGKTLLMALILTAFASSSAICANFSKTSATVETALRKTLELPAGPATQFISFHIPHNGLFIIATTDFSMRTSAETPFGPAKSKGNAPSPATIRTAMKTAILNCRKLQLPTEKDESLFIVIVNRQLFSRPDARQSGGITYKAYIPIRKLLTDTNPAGSIVME